MYRFDKQYGKDACFLQMLPPWTALSEICFRVFPKRNEHYRDVSVQ